MSATLSWNCSECVVTSRLSTSTRTFLIAWLSLGMFACEDTQSPSTSSTTGSGETSPSAITSGVEETQTTLDLGTQVGSEGFWGCVITKATEVGSDALVPGTDQRLEKATQHLAGEWQLTLDVFEESPVDGALWVEAGQPALQVETDGACGSYLMVQVEAVLDREESSVAMVGWAAFSATEYGLRLSAPSNDDAAQDVWGRPSSRSLAYLRLDASLAPTDVDLVGTIQHAACLTTSCAEQKDLALFVGNR